MIMTENIEEKLKKLKEIEAEELAELKQKRLLEAEIVKKENERKATEKLLGRLRKEKEMILKDLENVMKKNFSLQVEYDSWESVKKKTMEDLKMAEKTLTEKHEKIWKERELFCDETDKYLEEYGILSKWWKERMTIINEPQQFDRYYFTRNSMKRGTEKNQAIIKELEKEIQTLKNKLEQEEYDKLKNDALLKELESEKENLANEVKSPHYNSMLGKLESIKKRCYEITKLLAEKEREISMLENQLPLNTKATNDEFQDWDNNFYEEIQENSISDTVPTSNSSNFLPEATSVSIDLEEEMEVSPKLEIKQPNSFLFEMLDPSSIRAARAKAKTSSKPRSLSIMTPQERIRKLQVSFNDFLSEARK